MQTPFEKFSQYYNNKNVLIFGLGLLGRGVGDTRFFHEIGANLRVTDIKSETDLKSSVNALKGLNVNYIFGEHRKEDIEWADIIVRNASVPWHHPLLKYARDVNKPIVMDTQLFVHYAGVLTIGITGTRGKTTTTHMIYKLLTEHSKKKIILGGNISGIATLPLLKKIDDSSNHIAILELSSWQLQAFNVAKLSPNISLVTNIYEDHLNSYDDMSAYTQDKRNIIAHQTQHDHSIFNSNQKEIFDKWFPHTKSTTHWFNKDSLPKDFQLIIPGDHNRENAAAALEVGKIIGIREDNILSSLSTFKGVEFRLEKVLTIKGVDIYNDTTSTTPTATIKAIRSFTKPITLILGGTDKKLSLKELANIINNQVEKIVLLPGNGTDRILPLLESKLIIDKVDTLQRALQVSLNVTSPGEVILFSPGFTSFGMFANEYDRGRQFNNLLNDLNAKEK